MTKNKDKSKHVATRGTNPVCKVVLALPTPEKCLLSVKTTGASATANNLDNVQVGVYIIDL